MNAKNNIINGFAHKHRCSRFDQQRMIEALILELEELKGLNKTNGYEEPKEDGLDNIITLVEAYSSHDSVMYPKEIVEKLKAYKRLKGKGFKITLQGCKGNAWLQANWGNLQGDYSDVLFLFGGEE